MDLGEHSSVAVYWAYAFSVAVAFYFTLRWFGKHHLSQSAKDTLTLWLWGEYESTWSHHFCNLFDAVFGERHLSWHCFWRSSLASICSVVLLYLLFSEVLGIFGSRALGQLNLWQALFFGTLINIIPDYLSLLETRWLLKRFERVTSFSGQLAVLVSDALFTGTIIVLSINGALLLIPYSIYPTSGPLGAIEMLALFSIFSLFFYSTFATSVWAWIYCISTWSMRLFSRTPLRSILDIDTKPVEQLALVGAVFVGIVAFGITPMLLKEDKKNISVADEFLCSIFPSEICLHLRRLTSDEEEKLRYFRVACDTVGILQCHKMAIERSNLTNGEALYLFTKSCELGDAMSCTSAGTMYRGGFGVDIDLSKSNSFYQQGCDKGDVSGCVILAAVFLGDFEEITSAVDADSTAKVASLYERSCDLQHWISCAALGDQFARGYGVPQSHERAREFYELACDHNEGLGCLGLARGYSNGLGVEIDATKASHYYSLACNAGAARGCVLLGESYLYGQGVQGDPSRAASLYLQGCEGGEPLGCVRAGVSFTLGAGVQIDDVKATELFERACDQGNNLGCLALSQQYLAGRGVKQSDEKAEMLFKRACAGNAFEACQHFPFIEQQLGPMSK